MPFAAGTYTLPAGNPVNTNTTISSSWANTTLSDMATALTTCVLKDGTQTLTANIPMGGFKLTGLAAGNASGNSVRYEQVLLLTGGTMTGNLLFTDGLYNIGASGSGRPLNLYLAGTISVSGVTATGVTGSGNLVYSITPTFTGVPAAPTATFPAASTQLATTAYAENMRNILGTEQASTSGTTIDFTLPAGVRLIRLCMVGVGTSGVSSLLVQLGDAGGVETGSYVSGCGAFPNAGIVRYSSSTAGFIIDNDSSFNPGMHGIVTLALEDSSDFTWVASYSGNNTGATSAWFGGGSKALSQELTTVRLTSVSADTFNAGVVNIQYQY